MASIREHVIAPLFPGQIFPTPPSAFEALPNAGEDAEPRVWVLTWRVFVYFRCLSRMSHRELRQGQLRAWHMMAFGKYLMDGDKVGQCCHGNKYISVEQMNGWLFLQLSKNPKRDRDIVTKVGMLWVALGFG